MKMAEQLFLSGNIDENILCSLNTTQARVDIDITLLSHSVDMSERCIMCGASENSLIHPQYVHWIRCDNCWQWTHTICMNMKPEDAGRVERFQYHECFQNLYKINDFELLLLYVILLNVNRAQLPVIKPNNTGTANILYNYACLSIFESTLF